MDRSFLDIQFGRASAEAEFELAQPAFVNGFFDAEGHLNRLGRNRVELIVGAKGSGKTMLALRRMADCEGEPEQFCSYLTVAGMSLGETARLTDDTGSSPLEIVAVQTWRWLVLLHMIGLMRQDQAARQSGSSLDAVATVLERAGVLTSGIFTAAVHKHQQRSVALSIAGIAEMRSSQGPADPVARLGSVYPSASAQLMETIVTSRTASTFTLFIDGLDDGHRGRAVDDEALAGLFQAVYSINRQLADSHLDARICLLLRSDLLWRLPVGNANKAVEAFAIPLEWAQGYPAIDRLRALLNFRAQLSAASEQDIFERFFQFRVHRRLPYNYCRSLTRECPRDFVALLGYVQDESRRSGGALEPAVVSRAAIRFASEFLLGELRDELVLHLGAAGAVSCLALLRRLPHRFTYEELRATVDNVRQRPSDESPNAERMMWALISSGALGIVNRHERRLSSAEFSRSGQLSGVGPNDELVVHPGLRLSYSK